MTDVSPLSVEWSPDAEIVHGSAVSIAQQGMLIIGPSGSGKSSLALMLMALGAELVADDRTALTEQEDHVTLGAPPSLPPMIEARGVGLLAAQLSAPVPLRLVVDMGMRESHRLPPKRFVNVRGHKVALIHGSRDVQFSAALLQFMKGLRG